MLRDTETNPSSANDPGPTTAGSRGLIALWSARAAGLGGNGQVLLVCGAGGCFPGEGCPGVYRQHPGREAAICPWAPVPPRGHIAGQAAAGGLPNTRKAAALSGPGQHADLWPRLP